MYRLVSAALVVSLLVPSLPAFAADAVEAPASLPCQDTSDRAHARCITDALKAWKSLEHEYDEQEDDEIAAWKKEHAEMGIGSDYQKALRDFLNDVRLRRKEFDTQLNTFRKAFFNEQKTKRSTGDGRKATEKKLEKVDLDAAKNVCGTPDDDGEYRICMRIQLRKKAANVDNRSRTNSRVIHD
jgi:hypothetical protein